MGACCYSPTKRNFLWWYWLLLTSIVGIPMLLAALYVASARAEDEQAKKRRGRTAALIFWIGSVMVAIVAFYVVECAMTPSHTHDPNDGSFWNFLYTWGWEALAVQFFLATVAANVTEGVVRKKQWYTRIPLFVICVAAYLFLLVVLYFLGIGFRRPAIHAMQFMACMFPAHYWGAFKESPDSRHAWSAARAFLIAAGLFFLVSYCGEDFAQLICGALRIGGVQ
jgi:uncharacterized membrane protein